MFGQCTPTNVAGNVLEGIFSYIPLVSVDSDNIFHSLCRMAAVDF